jgi:membrane protease YdiL (CAAX protease family)
MTNQQSYFINCLIACVAASIFAFFAGDASSSLAQISVQKGGPPYLRELINAGIAGLLYLLWRRWRPAARYSSPKWGHIGMGLSAGLCVGTLLPALALGLLVLTGSAVIKPPAINPIALGVPFVFLIAHGFAEESLVRGIAQREGHHGFGALGGVMLGAICFSGLQAMQGYHEIWFVINSALFGACLGFLVLGPGGIWTAIGAHAGWSWLEIAVLGERGQIVKTKTWLAGSGNDSYGSPAFTLVVLGVLGLQLALHLRAQKRKA